MRFFPIVPRNVPVDDLAQYLEPFDQERAALATVLDQSAAGRLHAEWDINPPPPVMRAGWGPSGHRVSQYALGALGQDPCPAGSEMCAPGAPGCVNGCRTIVVDAGPSGGMILLGVAALAAAWYYFKR
jgi:hypothetical protein